MSEFDRMYEPHEAREDTVIFPAFRKIVPAQELVELAQHFADLENQQFGSHGFSFMVNRSPPSSRHWGFMTSTSSPRPADGVGALIVGVGWMACSGALEWSSPVPSWAP